MSASTRSTGRPSTPNFREPRRRSVANNPGQRTLTVMPSAATSSGVPLRSQHPARAVVERIRAEEGCRAATEVRHRILPQRLARM
jgi:hypothetical protein